ncbi:MAG TPA: M15 family metallopeptidase [Cellulomonas sp.]
MPSHRVQPPSGGVPTRRQLREAAGGATRTTAPGVEQRSTVAGAGDGVETSTVTLVTTRPAAGRGVLRNGSRGAMARWGVRVGVLATLAAVTVAVPLAQQESTAEESAADVQADLTLPDTVQALTSTASAVLPPASLVSGDATVTRAQIDVSRSEEREILPGCSGDAATGASNGQLPQSDLCYLWDGSTELRADAAEALAELNAMWVTRFGSDLCLSSGYRTLAEQRAVKAQKGGLAAPAGRSNHGWGLAIDFCTSQTTGVQWEWLNENAPLFGWENPSWAQPGGSGPYERWHWEYTKGVMADGEYYG